MMEFLKKDVDVRLLTITLSVLILFIGSSIYYNLSLNNMQAVYDQKIMKLEEIEKQLILQEEKIKELSRLKNSIKEDKNNLEKDYGVMKNEYEFLRLEKTALTEELDSKPFAKLICKATGNAKCQN